MLTRMLPLALAGATALVAAAPAQATTVNDPIGDFIPTYTGPDQADLDVVSFSVTYNALQSAFLIQSTMAGAIDSALGGFYAIGVNTGTGPNSFASIGLDGVRFNQVIAVQKDGTAAIGGVALAPGSVIISGATFSLLVPLSRLPSTGFDPAQYGFNIWPRSGAGGIEVISDFAPDDATISAAGTVPEPATWSMLILGFGACGYVLRRHRLQTTAFA